MESNFFSGGQILIGGLYWQPLAISRQLGSHWIWIPNINDNVIKFCKSHLIPMTHIRPNEVMGFRSNIKRADTYKKKNQRERILYCKRCSICSYTFGIFKKDILVRKKELFRWMHPNQRNGGSVGKQTALGIIAIESFYPLVW